MWAGMDALEIDAVNSPLLPGATELSEYFDEDRSKIPRCLR